MTLTNLELARAVQADRARQAMEAGRRHDHAAVGEVRRFARAGRRPPGGPRLRWSWRSPRPVLPPGYGR